MCTSRCIAAHSGTTWKTQRIAHAASGGRNNFMTPLLILHTPSARAETHTCELVRKTREQQLRQAHIVKGLAVGRMPVLFIRSGEKACLLLPALMTPCPAILELRWAVYSGRQTPHRILLIKESNGPTRPPHATQHID